MAGSVGIHLLGSGDVGVPPDRYPAALARLDSAGARDRIDLLLSTRGEVFQNRPALTAFLQDGTPGPDAVWLLATDQDPPHPRDTRRLGELIVESVEENPDLFGAEVPLELVLLQDFSIDAIVRVVAEKLADADASAVLVNIGPGGTAASIAVVLGCLKAGHVPRLVRTNRAADDMRPSAELAVVPRLKRWLARMRAYDVLAALDPDHARSWAELASCYRLDWSGAMTAPDSTARNAAAWYQQRIGRSLLERLGADDRSGEFLIRPWIHAAYAQRHPLSQPGGMTPHNSLRRLMKAEPRELRMLAQVEGQQWQCEFRTEMEALWRVGRNADHGRTIPVGDATGVVRAVPALAELVSPYRLPDGYPTWPPLRGAEVLALHTVGMRNVAPNGRSPMAEAVIGEADPGSVHLRLIATDDSTAFAASVGRWTGGRCASVEVLSTPADDALAIREAVEHGLRHDGRLLGVREVLVYVGPGTKAMNLGALLGALTWSMENAVPTRVGALIARGGGATTIVEWASSDAHARLAHDAVLQHAVRVAIDGVNLELAARLCSLGSLRWQAVAARARELRELTFGRCPRGYDSERLWPARMFLLRQIVGADPWRAIYTAAVIGEATWQTRRDNRDGTWADPNEYPSCNQLWKWRNDGPFGHKPWMRPPASEQIVACLTSAAAEHGGPGACGTDELVAHWRGLREQVDAT